MQAAVLFGFTVRLTDRGCDSGSLFHFQNKSLWLIFSPGAALRQYGGPVKQHTRTQNNYNERLEMQTDCSSYLKSLYDT